MTAPTAMTGAAPTATAVPPTASPIPPIAAETPAPATAPPATAQFDHSDSLSYDILLPPRA